MEIKFLFYTTRKNSIILSYILFKFRQQANVRAGIGVALVMTGILLNIRSHFSEDEEGVGSICSTYLISSGENAICTFGRECMVR